MRAICAQSPIHIAPLLVKVWPQAARVFEFCPPIPFVTCAYVVTPIDMFLVTCRHGHTSLLIVGLKDMTLLRVLAY